MANTYVFGGGAHNDGKFSIAAGDVDQTLVIGEASRTVVSTLAVHIVKRSGTFSITVKARSVLSVARKGNDDIGFVPIPYVSKYLNGSVGDGGLATTAITATSSILIPSTGDEIALDLDNTDGVADVYVTRIEGAA